MFRFLLNLRGNPRACVYTEPLWGLSMNLCLPYVSVYMLALGLNDRQIGLIASLYLLSQMFASFVSGAITDKFGRRKTVAVCDFICWCLPCLFWAFAQGFWFFVAAALLNGMMRISTVAWDCLFVEDTPKDHITRIYAWMAVFANLSALFAPIASIMVARMTLVPAVRILYINAFVIMTIKLLLLYKFSSETAIGRKRMAEAKGVSPAGLLFRNMRALVTALGAKGTKFSIVISVIVEVVVMLNATFWQVIAAKRIGVADALLPIFPMVGAVFSMALFFLVIPHISHDRMKKPFLLGFAFYGLGQLLLILTPGVSAAGYVLLFLSVLIQAVGAAILSVLRESIVALNVDKEERSRVMAGLHTCVILFSVPFGYIGGLLSDLNRAYPFVLTLGLLAIGAVASILFYKDTPAPTETT